MPSIETDFVAAIPGAATSAETAAVTASAPAVRRAMRCMWLAPPGVGRFMAGSVLAPPWAALAPGLGPAWHCLGLVEVGREIAERKSRRPSPSGAGAAFFARRAPAAPAHARQPRHARTPARRQGRAPHADGQAARRVPAAGEAVPGRRDGCQ